MRPLVSNSTTLHRKKSKHFTKAIKRAIILVSFGVNKTTLTPLSDLFALNDSFAFICLIPERLLCCSILTHSIRLFFKAKCCGFLSGSMDAGFQQSWNPLHKLKSLLFCIVRIMLACWNNNLSAVGIGWPWGAGGIPDMPRGSLGIAERCVCKSSGGCHCSCCEHFLNSLHKPLRDYGPVVLVVQTRRQFEFQVPIPSQSQAHPSCLKVGLEFLVSLAFTAISAYVLFLLLLQHWIRELNW